MQVLKKLFALGCVLVLLCELLCGIDVFAFEWQPLLQMAGWGGVMVLVLFNAALLLGALGLVNRQRTWQRLPLLAIGIHVAALLTLVFLADWMFRSQPFTAPLTRSSTALLSAAAMTDFQRFSLIKRAAAENREPLQVAYQRIWVNSPAVYRQHLIGATIDKYAGRYGIDPLLVFYLAYMNSFYGEAESGPIPIFRAITPETVRDLVQIRLPAWFVESAWRRQFMVSPLPGVPADSNLDFKFHYAFHKATLDVSSQPYDLNTYTDVLLVMQEYPEEFADVLRPDNASPVDRALRAGYLALANSALQKPYETPAEIKPLDAAYYDTHRTQLKRFARASYYKIALDFDFATRVMALVIKYQRQYYQQHMGEAWNQLPAWQQGAMTAMTRDLFTPGVGRPGYNLYAIPEINCAPVDYIAQQARQDAVMMSGNVSTLWRPQHPEYLWAGAAYRLRVFDELWSKVHAAEIPGFRVEHSIDAARQVIAHYEKGD